MKNRIGKLVFGVAPAAEKLKLGTIRWQGASRFNEKLEQLLKTSFFQKAQFHRKGQNHRFFFNPTGGSCRSTILRTTYFHHELLSAMVADDAFSNPTFSQFFMELFIISKA